MIEPSQRCENAITYAARLAAEKSAYRNFVDVHHLPDIFHYWSNRHVRPKLEAFGFSGPDEMFQKCVGEQCRRENSNAMRFVSIGSGNCDLEVNLARQLSHHFQHAGYSDFVLDCLDLNSTMLERGRIAAAHNGLSAHMNFVQVDLNHWNPAHEYDAVIANQSLHHVLELEDLFGRVKSCLKPDGSFIISDMIGRNGHRRWPEALDIVCEYWRRLPPSYRFNHTLQRYEESYEDWDCSGEGFEGIRSQDILPLLLDYFHFQLFIGFGNVIDVFVDRAFGHNFDAAAAWDRTFIDDIHKRDEEEIVSGRLKPTHMLAVAGKNPAIPMLFHKPLTPRFCVSATQIALPRPLEGSQSAYEWNAWPHSPQSELEIVCRRLKECEQRVKERTAWVEERTAWARELEQKLEERTVWARQLDQELESRTVWVRQLERNLEERTVWARQLDQELEERKASASQMNQELERLNQELDQRTEWALRLKQEVEDNHAQVRQLTNELEQLAWARSLDRHFHNVLRLARRIVRWARGH